MKYFKIIVILCLFINTQTQASRSLYVDGFANILGDVIAEDALLNFVVNRNIKTLLLYELHLVHNSHNLTNSTSNQVLADFIYKAKNIYGVTAVGAIAENSWFFANRIDAYNNTRTNALEKFDIYNLEFEFWVDASVQSGGYYCTTYLQSGGFTCDNDGAFQFFIQELTAIKTLATNNVHNIITEAYVGWPTATQAATIGNNLDRVLVHAYVSNPSTAFSYSDDRLIDFANGNPNLDVSIIFSSEPGFMQTWLQNNSMISAENTFTTDWANGSTTWTSNINLVGFTYFAYSHMTNVLLPIELKSFTAEVIQQTVQLDWETQVEINFSHFEIERKSENGTFQQIGKVNAIGHSITPTSYQFIDKVPAPSTNYYRLKQVETNGSYEYSETLFIKLPIIEQLKIYPSVATDILVIEIPTETKEINILNVKGQIIRQITTSGSNKLNLNITDLPKGVYFLNHVDNALNKETLRFVKQ